MYSKGENGNSAIDLARICIAKPGKSIELLLLYSFKDDFEAHDDGLQSRLDVEFEKVWRNATAELENVFGPASIGISCEDTDYVPLNGVGGTASWQIDGRRLWIAYAHEDREVPWLLMVGVL